MMNRKSQSQPLVLIVNHNEQASRWLRQQIESRGLDVVEANLTDVQRGEVDLVDLVQRNQPTVMIYDIAAPYFNSWTFFRLIRGHSAIQRCEVLLTTANRRAFEESGVVAKVDAYQVTGDADEAASLLQVIQTYASRYQDNQQDQDQTPAGRRSIPQIGQQSGSQSRTG